jgi:hypothetical protein
MGYPTPEVAVACCIALAMLLAFARGIWTMLSPRRRRTPVEFAPAARRAAPAETESARS